MPPQEIVFEQAKPTVEGAPDFAKLSADYWNNSVAEAVKKEGERKNAGIAVVTPSSGDALIDSFFTAFDTPVILPVQWPDDVPEGHPIRNLDTHVRLWDSQQWARFWVLNKEVKVDGEVDDTASTENLKTQFWFVIWISACDKSGRRIFTNAAVPEGEEQACKWLKLKFDGPAGLLTMNPIYIAALGFNGLLNGNEERDGKN